MKVLQIIGIVLLVIGVGLRFALDGDTFGFGVIALGAMTLAAGALVGRNTKSSRTQ